MQIRNKVSQFTSSTSIERKRNVDFNTFNAKQFENLFEQAKQSNLIEGLFNQSAWQVPCKTQDYNVIIEFDLAPYTYLTQVLKAFTIARVLEGKRAGTVYNEIRLIKMAIFESEGFKNTLSLEKFLDQELQKHSYQGNHFAVTLKKFLTFYKIENSEEIIDICSNIKSQRRLVRGLPEFEDIISFDEIINEYFRNASTDETMEFIPIQLWWLLTNIIPMRPTELLLLKKDCLEIKEAHSLSYNITVPRIKLKNATPERGNYEEDIEVDKKTYKILKEIVYKLNSVPSKSEYLLPVEYLNAFRKIPYEKKNKRINRRDFDDLRDRFYRKVVEEKYGKYNLERIKLGDTRHFAIINMALQGFNMLSIARMAGHNEIRSQHSYYSHAEHFSQSYVYRMTQNHLENELNGRVDSSGIIGWKRYIYDKGLATRIEADKLDKIVGRVEFGYCTEQKSIFPETCLESCKFCPKFLFKPAINDQDAATKWLSNTSEDLSRKIQENIRLMRDLSISLSKRYTQGNDDLLKSTSKQLTACMDRKAIIDSKLMGDEAIERK